MSHTEGEWKVMLNSTQRRVCVRTEGATIATVHALIHQTENAHLLAASKDLLAALVRLSKAADGIDIDDKPEAWAELFAAQEDAAAAIARATP